MDISDFKFNEPLIEGIIVQRKSQFTMLCNINGEIISCHCPTTGRIGNLDVNGLPCLLSKSHDSKRKTPYTVEAVSLNKIEHSNKSWIGINQNAANRYVEHYLLNGGFNDMLKSNNSVLREQFLGISKLDFLVDDTYIEVKTPLQHLQIDYPDYIKTKKVSAFNSTDRFVKHITELGKSLKTHEKAILLLCFIYDNPGFKVIERSTHYSEVAAAIDKSIDLGLEIWQANFQISKEGVKLNRYFKIHI